MKFVLIAGGLGKRLIPLNQGNKALIQVNNKPVLYYQIKNALKLFNSADIIIVTKKEDIVEMDNTLTKEFNYRFTFKIQDQPLGIPDAMVLVKDLVDDFTIYQLGDFYSEEIFKFVYFSKIQKSNVLSLNAVNNPEKYGVLDLKSNLVIEKPSTYVSNIAVRGLYCLDKTIFDTIPNLKKSARGEFEVVDLINQLPFFSTFLLNKVYDLGSQDGLLEFSNHLIQVRS